VTVECAEDCYRHLSQTTSRYGPYAAIYDLSAAKDTTIPTEIVTRISPRGRGTPRLPCTRWNEKAGVYGMRYAPGYVTCGGKETGHEEAQ
jgi:hypothetical protein